MASYTMQLREYIEQASQYEDLPVRQQIEIGRKKLFDFEYPIFDNDYKKIFETNFIRHFYMREIGFETEGLFKFQLETWLMINLPYFNKLLESTLLKYDPLTNASMTIAHEKILDKDQKDVSNAKQNSNMDGSNSEKSNQTNDANSQLNEDKFKRDLASTTPDGRLSITAENGKGLIEYASGMDEEKIINKSNSDSQSKGNSASDSTSNVTSNTDQTNDLVSEVNEIETFLQKRVGKIGVQSYAKLVNEYRQSLVRIEKQIFDEMQQLFMLVY